MLMTPPCIQCGGPAALQAITASYSAVILSSNVDS